MALLAIFAGVSAAAQQQGGQASLAATLDVYVFPKSGQAGDQQSSDEAECYQWAVSRSGADPFEATRQTAAAQQEAAEAQQQTARATQGAGVRGAVGGAAVGALIGGIASDDAGEGAAYGAAAGTIMARRRAAAAQQQTAQQGQQQVAQANAQAAGQIENFKKAFSVCLEAKEYLVKF
ncbi:MAG: hypothetical protein KF911_01715 [Pseudomonadales bacterium]|nr:hypothetical protein [Pseudomonadales bacterium]